MRKRAGDYGSNGGTTDKRGGHVQKEKKESRIYHHGNFSGLKGKVVRYKWITQR